MKRPVATIAGGVFLATYIPLMTDFLSVTVDFIKSRKDIENGRSKNGNI